MLLSNLVLGARKLWRIYTTNPPMSADVVHQKDESGSVPFNSEPLHSLKEDFIFVNYWTHVIVQS